MDVPRHLAALRNASARMDELLPIADLDAPVPPCPEWVVRDLIRHLGGIHRWATTYVGEARTAPIEHDLEELVGGWPDDRALAAWFSAGHRTLAATLEAAPPDLECYTFLESPSPRQMWARRQAHETSIHRVDLEAALGLVTGFPADLASDGIDELLTAFITRPGRGPRSDEPVSMAVVPEDVEARWTVFFDSGSCTTVRAHEASTSTVTGTASDLYAWLWNRPSPGVVALDGAPTGPRRWQETMHVRWS